MWPPPRGPWVELPLGPRTAVLGVADACGHANSALGGAPYGATRRYTEYGGRMWPPLLGPEVELPMGPRSV
eukprot:3096534-Pyramimonas_sp.AAC.1